MTPLSDHGTRWTTADIADPIEAVESDTGATAAVLVEDGHVVAAGGTDAALPDAVDPPTGEYDQWVERAFDDCEPTRVPQGSGPRTALLSARDGQYHYHYVGVAPGSAADWLALFVDITAMVERYERLALFESLVERAQDGLYATDGDGRIDYCNDSFASSLDTGPETLRGRPVVDLAVEADRETYETALDRLRTGDCDRMEVEITHRAGDDAVELSVHLAPRDGDDPEAGVVAVARDVTDRKARERRLEQYRALVESADDPMWVLDADGRIEVCNEALAARLGTDADALAGDHVTEALPDEAADALAEALASLGVSGDERFVDLTVRLRDDGERAFDGTVGAIVDDDRLVGSVGILRDVTERERRTADLTLLKRLLGTALRSDVQTTMDEIRAEAEAIAADAADGITDRARTIRDTAGDMASVAEKCDAIEGLVDTDPTPAPRDLSVLVEEALDGLREHNPDATLSVSVPSVAVLAVDELTAAVENLVENALEHAGPAPTVRVEATVEETSVTLSIADDGPGIEQNEIDALERGTETDLAHLSGVGLWLADWIVEQSGGDLDIDATIQGTTALIRLERPVDPSDDASGDASAHGNRPRPAANSGVTDPLSILCIDPDERIARAIRDAGDPEMVVRSACDVDDAAALLTEESIDCLVSERLTASEFDRLRTATPDLPIVLYTAADHTDLDETILTGVDSIVERGHGDENAPFLRQKIRAIVGSDDTPADPFDDSLDSSRLSDDLGADSIALSRDGAVVWETTVGRSTGESGDLAVERPETPPDGIETRSVDGETRYRRRTTISLGNGRRLFAGTDVTRIVRRYRRLALYERLLNRAQDGISVVDANGEIRYHNPSFGSLLGYEDMVDTHTSEYLAEGELRKGQHAVQRLLSTPELDSEVLDMDFVTADDERITLAVHYTARLVDGDYAGLINVARDVTDRKARERRLEQYRTLVETVPDPVFALDADGRIELCNEAAAEFAGQSADALGDTPLESVVDSSAFCEEYQLAMASIRDGDSRDESFEVWLRAADGERRNYAVRITTQGRQRAVGAVVTFRDVTERTRRETELDRLRTVFSRVLRHNLRNGLNVVMSNARSIEERSTGVDRERASAIREQCEDLLVTCGHARALVEAIERRDTTITRRLTAFLDHLDEETADVDLAVRSSLPSGLSIRTHPVLETGLGAIATALSRVEGTGPVKTTVTPADDTVDLTLTAPGSPPDAIRALERGPDAVIENGTSVGLWLAAWLVEQSGGTVGVRATGDRTAVTVTLPVEEPTG